MNKKGQFNWLMGLMVLVMTLLIFGALFSVIIKAFGMSKGADGANCRGYIDNDATASQNQSYNSGRNTDTLSCTILDFGPGMITMAVIFGLVAALIAGTLWKKEEPQPQYQAY